VAFVLGDRLSRAAGVSITLVIWVSLDDAATRRDVPFGDGRLFSRRHRQTKGA
jgi:hypothetical protein